MGPGEYEKPKLSESTINGYRYFTDYDHPLSFGNSGTVYEHRHEASVKLGHWLTREEIVHHLDSSRNNNEHSNLRIVELSEHSRLHATKRGCVEQFEVSCPICGKLFTSTKRSSRYCSLKCLGTSNRRTNRPSRGQLAKEIDSMSWLALGRKYGVSDNAVRKWAKKYGLL